MKTALLGTATLILVLASAPKATAAGRGGHGGGHAGHTAHTSHTNHTAHTGHTTHTAHTNHVAHTNHDNHFRYGYGRGGRYGYNFGLARGFDHGAYLRANGTRFSHGYYFAGRNHNHWTWNTWSPRYNTTLYYSPAVRSWYYWYAPAARYYPISYASVAVPTTEVIAPPTSTTTVPPLPADAGDPPALPDDVTTATIDP